MEKPTQKQLDYIADIEQFSDEKFIGTTKQEASAYISRNKDKYRLEMEVSSSKFGYE